MPVMNTHKIELIWSRGTRTYIRHPEIRGTGLTRTGAARVAAINFNRNKRDGDVLISAS